MFHSCFCFGFTLGDSKKKVLCQSYSLWGILFLGVVFGLITPPKTKECPLKREHFYKEIKFNKALLKGNQWLRPYFWRGYVRGGLGSLAIKT